MNWNPASDGGAGFSRIFWELIRIAIIAGIVFGFYQWRTVNEISDVQATSCRNSFQIRHNQEIVIRTLIKLVINLNDRQDAGLRQLPPKIFDSLETALVNIPQINC